MYKCLFLVEDLFRGRRRHCVAWQNPRNLLMRIGWLVCRETGEIHRERTETTDSKVLEGHFPE
jgi:hypothetical protein